MSAKKAIHQLGLELMRPAKKKYPRRQVVTSGADDIFGADIADFSYFADQNDGYKYWSVFIDCFNRFAWVIPMKDKTAATTLKSIEQCFKQNNGVACSKLWCDKGGEYYSRATEKWAKSHDIVIYSTYSESKSVMAERLIGTLKRMVWIRFMTEHTRRWIDILPEIVDQYNNTVHSSIHMTPTQARTKKGNAKLMKEQENMDLYTSPGDPLAQKFHLGDYVRISRVKGIFEKGSSANWSTEVFTVHTIIYSNPVTYHLADYNNEVIEGSFYAQELMKTEKPDLFVIESILKTKTVKKKKMLFVKWLGYPASANSWIEEGSTETI